MNDIGIIGLGVVGNAVYEGMKHAFTVETFDKYRKSTTTSIKELFIKVDGPIFICVPTPMKKDVSVIQV